MQGLGLACGCACLLGLLVTSTQVQSDSSSAVALHVVSAEGDELLNLSMTTPDWCLLWNHSVAGFTVKDCFTLHNQTLYLVSSHQPDFAAGLGHIEGRGELTSDGQGGYWIHHINEPLVENRLRIRVGSAAVNHRIESEQHHISLTDLAAGQAVEIRLIPHP